MFAFLNFVFHKISQKTSYTVAVASTASFSALITIFFVFYYLNAINFPFHLISIKAIFVTVTIGIILHAYQFGGFHKWKLKSFIPAVNFINSACEFRPRLAIRRDIKDPDLIRLWKAINFIIIVNAITASVWIIIHLLVLTFIGFQENNFHKLDLFIYISTAIIAIVIHGGFSYIFSDILTGNLRKLCYTEMFRRGLLRENRFTFSIRAKLTFTLILFAIALHISNSLTYYRRDDITAVIVFSLVAVIVCFLMARLIFNSVDFSIEEIARAVQKLEQGNAAIIAPHFNDRNLLTMADKMNHVISEILDYQQNLEKKVGARTKKIRLMNQQLLEKEHHLNLELQFAGDIQKGIYPEDFLQSHNLEVASFYQAMHIVSGDYLDVFPLKNNYLGILLTDASGHGVPAALVTMMAKVAFHTAALKFYRPAQIFEAVNKELAKLIKTQDYLTAFLFSFDDKGRFYYSNAAHINAIVYRAESHRLEFLDTDGMILGVFAENANFAEKKSALKVGDRILVFSDGILDSKNSKNERLTLSQFEKIILHSGHLPVRKMKDAIMKNLHEYIFEARPHDDKSLMVIGLETPAEE